MISETAKIRSADRKNKRKERSQPGKIEKRSGALH